MNLPPNSKRLCERCTRMTSTLEGLQELASRQGYKHLSIEELYSSAALGCSFCTILTRYHKRGERGYPETQVQILPRSSPLKDDEIGDHMAQSGSTDYPFTNAKLDDLQSCKWYNWTKAEDTDSRSLDSRPGWLYPFTGQDDTAAPYTNIEDDHISVSGPEIEEEILKRLELCMKNHSCCPKSNESCLPSRVIDVRPKGEDDKVYLYTTQSKDASKYLALSYVWGGPQEVTTTTATLLDKHQGISMPNLPLTIQDAIRVTRNLGFRYLWIDALCIIQDDDEDKKHEIKRMGTIYKNATMTIAAANTTSVNESFLAPRPIPGTCPFPYLLPDGTFGTLWIKDKGHPEPIQSPLDSRAWACQESLLSPRILWYGPAHLKWICNVDKFPDCNLGKAPTYYSSYNYKHRRLPQSIYGLAEELVDDIDTLRSRIWIQTMMDYSSRALTYHEDRLPALSGVASETQKVWGDEYYAGMWQKYLVRHLAWHASISTTATITKDADTENLHLPKQDQSQSPTWSWTSYKGQVGVEEVEKSFAEVLDCRITLVDDEFPLSRLIDGRLELDTACITEEDYSQMRKSYPRELPRFTRFYWDYDQCEDQDHINKSFVYALLGFKERDDFVALVLAPLGDGTFMRIGIFRGASGNVLFGKPRSLVRKRIIII
ncbi:HET-domain-containing protein [Mollisia scopiformis]|uniref:HET-domain-containing protein n=1 Tax=Mollisia scopiformis TaxID=149040 RepID=A0A194XJV1_MOLSC|nr:HET-domain-containing protein [Mollisia scopiformis]KUJ20428.1 HET-domain-containing protein [Mollisia scopiformis]